MFARVTTLAIPADRREDSIRSAKEVAPSARRIPGSAGVYVLADLVGSKAVAVTLWETQEALEESRAEATRIRREAAATSGSAILSVDEYEVIVQP